MHARTHAHTHTHTHICAQSSLITGLKEAADRIRTYNILMKDFPINKLLSANNLPAITSSVEAIFHHLMKLQHSQYSITRVKHLVGAISEDVSKQMLKVCT